MLSVKKKTIMLSVIVLNVTMLSVIMLNITVLSFLTPIGKIEKHALIYS
jgi:hypothetical protein